MTYNRFDADNFINLMTEMRDSLKTDLLKADFDNIINCMQLAKEKRDVEYIIQIYRIVHDMEYFLSIALMAMEVVSTPNEELEEENYIRDVADRPILRAALNAKADILLTGDKDFLESGVTNPKIMTAAEFIAM